MKNYVVYIHRFPNGKIYVGITKQKPEYRWRNGKHYSNNIYMTNAITKYGWDNIEHIILYNNLTKEQAEQKEIELIKFYKSNIREFGYNILNGGNASNGMAEETRKKMSKDRKGKHYSKKTEFKKGHKPWTTGKKMTPEFRKKLSLGHIGQKPVNSIKVICIETNKIYFSITDASKDNHITINIISDVCKGKRKDAHGLHFEYYKK